MFFGAILPQFVNRPAGHVPQQMALLALIFSSLAFVPDSAWGLVAGTARDWFAPLAQAPRPGRRHRRPRDDRPRRRPRLRTGRRTEAAARRRPPPADPTRAGRWTRIERPETARSRAAGFGAARLGPLGSDRATRAGQPAVGEPPGRAAFRAASPARPADAVPLKEAFDAAGRTRPSAPAPRRERPGLRGVISGGRRAVIVARACSPAWICIARARPAVLSSAPTNDAGAVPCRRCSARCGQRPRLGQPAEAPCRSSVPRARP